MTKKVSPIRDALEEAVKNVGGAPPEREAEDNGLPQSCPVRPLGMDAGVYYYIDAKHQFRILLARAHSRLNMLSLFGAELEFLHDRFYSLDKNGANTGKINTGQLEEALLLAGGAAVLEGVGVALGGAAWDWQVRVVGFFWSGVVGFFWCGVVGFFWCADLCQADFEGAG